jgi:prepilin-type N-terminal cleavage/methylation domain-containing protein
MLISKTGRCKYKNAFTLIELLVVIAIISLLVSILLPSLNRAKELARRAVCSVNQRTMVLASVMYADEYNEEYLPYGGGWNYMLDTAHGPWGGLFDTGLIPGAENAADRTAPGVADVAFCPSQETPAFMQSEENGAANNNSSFMARYHFPPGPSAMSVQKISDLPSHSEIIADVFIYSSYTHENEGVNVGSLDGSVVWSDWPDGIHPWPAGLIVGWQGVYDYWDILTGTE